MTAAYTYRYYVLTIIMYDNVNVFLKSPDGGYYGNYVLIRA